LECRWIHDSNGVRNFRWKVPTATVAAELSVAATASHVVLVEFFPDTDANEIRAIRDTRGLILRDHPDLLASHILVEALLSNFAASQFGMR